MAETTKQSTGKERAAQKRSEHLWETPARPATPTPGTAEQTIWYECVDSPKYYAKSGHKSFRQDGTTAVEAVLNNPENEGALMITFDNRRFIIQDGAMLPSIQLGEELKN